MIIEIKNITENPANILRRMGYIFQHKIENDQQMSFIRPLSRAGYPRFHIYAQLKESDLILNIHLDQKRGTYGKSTRHHGEYADDGPLRKEVLRLKTCL